MGVQGAIRQELPCMAFHTPHGSARHRLPWSWSCFDYRALCERAVGAVRCPVRDREGGGARRATPSTPTAAPLTAPLIVDALGWRRVLGPAPTFNRPRRAISRGLEVHPDGGGEDLDVWMDRALSGTGSRGRCPLPGSSGSASAPTSRATTSRSRPATIAGRLGVPPVRYQGNWFPHKLRPATEDGVFFVGDSAGHCFPLSGRGHPAGVLLRHRVWPGAARGARRRAQPGRGAGRLRAVLRRHARAFGIALALQWLIPRLPPRMLTAMLGLVGRRRLCDRMFGWYLRQADPAFAVPVPAPPRTQAGAPAGRAVTVS